MQLDQLRECLESPEKGRQLLETWGLQDLERGHQNLVHLSQSLGLENLHDLVSCLSRILGRGPDPDMALNNLERFLASVDGARKLPSLLEGRGRVLETLLLILGTSQFLSDVLATQPDQLETLRLPLRKSPSPKELQESLQADADAAFEDSRLLRVFRQFRQKHILRIGANDIIRERPLEEITRDLSRVADASLQVALATSWRHVAARFGEPFTLQGQPARCVILAFGKHGGEELNYSSDIDLMFVFDEEGTTRAKRVALIDNQEFFGRVVSEVVRLLSAHTDQGQAYRIDLRLRPEGHRGPLARSMASTLSYYDTLGRTWERQALIKLRPVAGDLELGQAFMKEIEPFVYRKYLGFADINEIKALKRRIEQKANKAGTSESDVKTGHGGIRDIEFAIQFLQLLNGGDLPSLRQRNTLQAMQALAEAGCLSDQEYRVLTDAYCFLRKTEHRLQLLFDLQTHRMPSEPEELHKLALRMGYADEPLKNAEGSSPVPAESSKALAAFLKDHKEKTDLNRKILNHLLHDTFHGEDSLAEPESDLILDPNPDPETIRSVLGRYPFKDVTGAYNNLSQLAQESFLFLSTPRCRHFLASIAPKLLRALADTPDPDMALVNLEKVTASLGAKAVLYELFSYHLPSLKLYVDLCAWSEYLSEILINNPGMIDELLDSLVLNQPRTLDELRQELAELCRGAADTEPILHSFQSKELLRIGVRDILGKDTIQATAGALTDLAVTLLEQIARLQEPPLLKRFGLPYLAEGPRAGQPSRWALIGLGKLGAREMSYHSDLDLIVIYEGDGRTGPPPEASRFERFELTDNFHFFTELTQRIIKATSFLGPMGRLYQVDMRLRPTGKSGSLVIPLTEFRRYYEEKGAQLWERQALCRAAVLYGDTAFTAEVTATIEQAVCGIPWKPSIVDEIKQMRQRLEESRGQRDLKRGIGGIVDVEFIVQLFKIKYGRLLPRLLVTNTWNALAAERDARLISEHEYDLLKDGFDFLRMVESRLRIVHNRTLDELPESAEEQEKLARRLGWEVRDGRAAGERFLGALERHTRDVRELFVDILDRERRSKPKVPATTPESTQAS